MWTPNEVITNTNAQNNTALLLFYNLRTSNSLDPSRLMGGINRTSEIFNLGKVKRWYSLFYRGDDLNLDTTLQKERLGETDGHLRLIWWA